MSKDRDKAPPVPASVKVAGEFTYSTTLYSLQHLPNFSAYRDRKRLSSPNLLEFLKIAKRWKISEKNARLLLGGISAGYYRKITTHPERRILRQDQLTRVAFLIEIYGALNTMLGQKGGAKWVRLATQEWPFHGLSPLDYLAKEGIVAIHSLRNNLVGSMARSS